MISSFTDKYAFLSNFFESTVHFEGIEFPSSEAAFQAAKTADMQLRREFCSLKPGQAKRKGRTIPLRAEWEAVKDSVMYRIVKAKFTQNAWLKRQLIATGDEYLEEGNTWHDNTWGNCTCPKCADIPGANRLGKILMRVRDELRD